MGRTYTVKQVADILGYSTNSIYTFLKEGRIVGVRLGKGRFRIPQEELDKILHLKKFEIAEPTVTSTVNPVSQIRQSIKQQVIPSLARHLEEIKTNSPCLFDWFVSLVSIIIGFTMVLFVRNFEEFSKVQLSQFFLPIKINLLMAGIGLLVVNYLNQVRKNWFYLFYWIILVNFIIYGLILFLGNDLLGSFFFILIIAMMIFQLVIKPKGSIAFKIFVTLLSIFFPILLNFYPSVIDFNQIASITGLSSGIVLIFLLLLSFLVNIIIWFFHKTKGPLYWISLTLVCAGLAYYSYLYSVHLYWSQTLVFNLVIIFFLISSFWDSLNQNYKNNRRIIINIFTDIVIIFIVITSLIWLIQNNTRVYVEQTLINELAYGQNAVETAISNSRDKMEVLANNQLFKGDYDKKDAQLRDELIKNIFIFSSSFRRILLADKDGNIVSLYPQASLSVKNVAFRDYFKQVQSTKKTYISNLYETTVNGAKRRVVSVNVPILDSQENFNGIIIGSLDIDSISNHLQQIANKGNNEYFFLIDGTGQPIIMPENITLNSAEINRLQISNSNDFNVEETLNSDNKLIQIHTKIDNIGWMLVIRRPLLETYNFDELTNIVLNLTFIFSGLLIVYLNIIHADK